MSLTYAHFSLLVGWSSSPSAATESTWRHGNENILRYLVNMDVSDQASADDAGIVACAMAAIAAVQGFHRIFYIRKIAVAVVLYR
jgi:hypothetical protein